MPSGLRQGDVHAGVAGGPGRQHTSRRFQRQALWSLGGIAGSIAKGSGIAADGVHRAGGGVGGYARGGSGVLGGVGDALAVVLRLVVAEVAWHAVAVGEAITAELADQEIVVGLGGGFHNGCNGRWDE